MLRYIPALAMAVAPQVAAQPASAQTNGACPDLAAQWTLIEQNLAANFASSITDNSAPRETNRQLRDLGGMQSASLIYEMMKDNRCPLPKSPPRAKTYASAALKCENDRLTDRNPASCTRDTWTKGE